MDVYTQFHLFVSQTTGMTSAIPAFTSLPRVITVIWSILIACPIEEAQLASLAGFPIAQSMSAW